MKRTFLLLMLLCFAMVSLAQKQRRETDSIIHIINTTKDDTTKVNALNEFSKILWRLGSFEKAMGNANEALTVAKRLNFKKGMATAYNNIGAIYTKQTNYPEGLKNYQASLDIRREINNKPAISSSYINIGNAYLQMDNYPEALKNYINALKIGEDINDTGIISNCYNSIGNVYTQQGNYADALKNYFTALKLVSNDNFASMADVNIGEVYTKQKNYEGALKSFSSALEMQNSARGDSEIISTCYDDIGNIYMLQGKYAEALKNYLAAVDIQVKMGYKYELGDSYINIGKIYLRQHEMNLAKDYLDKGLNLAKENESKTEMKEAYNGLCKLDSATGNMKEAFHYSMLYSAVKDSIINEESNKQVSQLKIQYETDKNEKEIALLNKNNEIKTIRIERQEATVKYLIGIFSLLILFTIIAFWLSNQKRKVAFKHEILDTKMTALRSQMNPHFTFNVLNSIQYYAGENDMKSVQHYLRQFSKLIRLVLDQSRTSYITLEQEITMLKLYLELEEMRFEEKFKYSIESQLDELETKKILIPGMLIQPLVENAIKHGIEHKEGEALISLLFYLEGNTLICKVKDNGIGRAAAVRLKSEGHLHLSAGTSIIKERMEALSSIYNIHLECKTEDLFDSEGNPDGTCVTVEIPVEIKKGNVKFKMEV